MFQKHTVHIDENLEKEITELTWTSEGSKEFLEEAVVEVSHLSELYNSVTSNLKVIKQKF
jgi:hypothetical protein